MTALRSSLTATSARKNAKESARCSPSLRTLLIFSPHGSLNFKWMTVSPLLAFPVISIWLATGSSSRT
jgi:hypothetical protein